MNGSSLLFPHSVITERVDFVDETLNVLRIRQNIKIDATEP